MIRRPVSLMGLPFRWGVAPPSRMGIAGAGREARPANSPGDGAATVPSPDWRRAIDMIGEGEAPQGPECGGGVGAGRDATREDPGSRWNGWGVYGSAVVLSVVLVTWALRLWEADLFVPFGNI